MQALIGPLQELAEFEAIQKEKQKEAGVLQISGCVNSLNPAYDIPHIPVLLLTHWNKR